MSADSFVHLHVHSEYSLLDGACRVEGLCRKSAEEGAPGIALTDHGVMYGAVDFYDTSRKFGLTPIIGCEAYIAPRGRFDRTVREEAHVTLLAASDVGYKNLTALVSKGHLEGYYYKPRIDMDLLARHNEGLIVLSGCMSSLVAAPLLKNDYETSRKNAIEFAQIFGDRFYIEIMRHGMPEEDAINDGLIRLAREDGYKLVATNDSHYLTQGDAPAHDVLLCIGTGKTISDASRMKFFSDQFYVKSAEEMRALFADVPEACDNTLEIVKRIDLTIPEKVFYLPDYPVPQSRSDDVAKVLAEPAPGEPMAETTANEYLRLVCEQGLVERYGAEAAAGRADLRERLDYEMGVITETGFAAYFLITWDFIKYARDRDIPVGPGRGSAVGSLVSYCLRITDLDPLVYGLYFERFLNPERISMPDIDTDFCVERRDEVIDYVAEKYGRERVAQIVTFGTMASRAAVRDAGRALGVPLPEVDKIAKLIPSGPGGLSIGQAIAQVPEIAAVYARDPAMRELLDTAESIEGLARNASTHAAGVVISKNPLIDHVPLARIGESGINTQYEMGDVERIGLLKMDFLGLRNLTVMKAASDEIRRTVNPGFDLAAMPPDDAKTFEMLARADTLGVFQLESEGMKRVCAELRPSKIDDIIALVALYRPGPMDFIPDYIAVKHGRKRPSYLHPLLEIILKDTNGIACLRKGTPVWSPGYSERPIEALRAGDEVLTFDDGQMRPAKVARVWPSGKKRILRIALSSGASIECSEDHRFPTPAGDVFARDLRPNAGRGKGRYIHTEPESILFQAWTHPGKRSAGAFSIGGPGKAWLLGMLIGDGCLKTRGSVCICAGTKEDADVIAAAFKSEFGCRTTTYFNTRCWYVRPAFDATPKPTPITLWLDSLYGDRTWKATSGMKRLPERFADLDDDQLAELLSGLWDSDGTYGTPCYFRSTSPALVRQVAEILSTFKIAHYVRNTAVYVQDRSRFGTIVGISRLPKKHYPTPLINVMPVLTSTLKKNVGARVAGDYDAYGCMKRSTAATMTKVSETSAWTKTIGSFWAAYDAAYEHTYMGDTRPVYIDSIECVGEDECFDLQMEDQSNPYFVANGIATHNCYQEQIMRIARDLAGFSMGQADELRKVVGKKIVDKMPLYRQKFIDGCKATNGIDTALAEQIFAFIEPFARYGFNKAHATAYGWISYQTAFLKANYPLQYLTALMSSVRDKTDKLVEYIEEARRGGIDVLPPHVNESMVAFAVAGRQIRFGLAAVKGVGENAVQAVLDARSAGEPFADLFDLVRRVDPKAANKKVYEALIKCGALDGLGANRAQLLDALDTAVEAAAREHRDRETGQASLFGLAEEPQAALAPAMKDLSPPSKAQMLAWERETLGIFVSGHPLDDVAEALARAGATPIRDLGRVEENSPVRIAGLVAAVRRTMTKAQAQMLIATVEDATGTVECVVFPRQYGETQEKFAVDAVLVLTGKVRSRERMGADDDAADLNLAVEMVSVFDPDAVMAAEPVPCAPFRSERAQSGEAFEARDVPNHSERDYGVPEIPAEYAAPAPVDDGPPPYLDDPLVELLAAAAQAAPAPPTHHGWTAKVTSRTQIDRLAALLAQRPGTAPLILVIEQTPLRRTISADPDIPAALAAICESVEALPRPA